MQMGIFFIDVDCAVNRRMKLDQRSLDGVKDMCELWKHRSVNPVDVAMLNYMC